MTLTPETLATAMGNALPLQRYRELYPACRQALIDANCTTVNRAAMWLAQTGHESGGLKWMEEIASGAAYEGRQDLGNTQPGDGIRYKGRGPIQITGRYNYTQVSQWAYTQGLVPTPTYFVDNPTELASDRYGFTGATWYWTIARPMNTYADNADILGATKAVNGGTNGLDDRTQRWNHCRAMGNAIIPTTTPQQGGTTVVSSDPTWLETILRPALGNRLKTLPGWQTDGVGGSMGQIWGIIWHHTGNAAETPESISIGRPDLKGPLAQLHIAPDGTVTIVAVGPCNHAGAGSWPGLPTDNANAYTIGIECAWPRDTTLTEETANREPWPDPQIIAMRDTGAALTKYLGVDVSHNISHKEWARLGPLGQRQYKWDPGNLDMNWFRGEIAKAMRGDFDPQPPTPTQPPAPQPQEPAVDALTPKQQADLYNTVMGTAAVAADNQTQLRGPGLRGWQQLGGRTLVDAVAAIGEHLGINGFKAPEVKR